MIEQDRRVVEGFRLPSTEPLSDNEWRWIEVLRETWHHPVPAPTLAIVQALRSPFGVCDLPGNDPVVI